MMRDPCGSHSSPPPRAQPEPNPAGRSASEVKRSLAMSRRAGGPISKLHAPPDHLRPGREGRREPETDRRDLPRVQPLSCEAGAVRPEIARARKTVFRLLQRKKALTGGQYHLVHARSKRMGRALSSHQSKALVRP